MHDLAGANIQSMLLDALMMGSACELLMRSAFGLHLLEAWPLWQTYVKGEA